MKAKFTDRQIAGVTMRREQEKVGDSYADANGEFEHKNHRGVACVAPMRLLGGRRASGLTGVVCQVTCDTSNSDQLRTTPSCASLLHLLVLFNIEHNEHTPNLGSFLLIT